MTRASIGIELLLGKILRRTYKLSVRVMMEGNGFGSPSSNPELDCLCFTLR